MPLVVDELLERNIARLRLHPMLSGQLVPPNAEQIALTGKWILPNETSILADVLVFRKEADAILFQHPVATLERLATDKEYPYGMCLPIRDTVYASIKAAIAKNTQPGMRVLRKFLEEGGIMRPFWGIDKGMYFQNAIQIGDTILDVANDTVDENKIPIILYRSVADAPIKPVTSFIEYARVAESYWHHDIYPNFYLPELAPVFPMLSVQPVRSNAGIISNFLVLHMNAADMAFKNLYTEFEGYACGLARQFLFESDYAEKRLPPALLEQLKGNAELKKLQETYPDLYRISEDPAETRAAFGTFRLDPPDMHVTKNHTQKAEEIRIAALRLQQVPLGKV